MNKPNRCPVCQASFRGAAICSRCGADLGRMMLLTAEAWKLRTSAQSAIAAGDFALGFELADKAQNTQWSRQGEFLLKLVRWLRNA